MKKTEATFKCNKNIEEPTLEETTKPDLLKNNQRTTASTKEKQ